MVVRHRRTVIGLVLLVVGGVAVVVARPPDSSIVVATVAVDRYSSPLFVNTRDGLVFAGANGNGRIRVLDTATGRLLRTVALPQPPASNMMLTAAGIIPDTAVIERLGRVYLLGQPMGSPGYRVMVLDAHSGRLVATVPVPPGGSQAPLPASQAWLAADARTQRLFVLIISFPAVYVSIYDAHSLRLLRTTTVSAPPYTNSGWGIAGSPLAVDERTNRVFASHADSNRVGILDARSGRLLGTTALRPLGNTLGGNPQITAPVLDERLGRVYVADFAGGAVNILDAASGRLLRSVPLSTRAGELLVDEPSRRLFVDTLGGINMFDAMTGRLLSTIGGAPVGGPGWPVVDERSGHIYVANWSANIVNVLDGVSGRTLYSIAVGLHPYGMAVDQDSGRVFVACLGPFGSRTQQPTANGSVSVLDGRRGVLLRTIPAGLLPGAVIVDGPHRRALVFNNGGSVVKVFDPWGWVPGWLRRRMPFLPPSRPTRALSGSVTVLDTSRL